MKDIRSFLHFWLTGSARDREMAGGMRDFRFSRRRWTEFICGGRDDGGNIRNVFFVNKALFGFFLYALKIVREELNFFGSTVLNFWKIS